MQVSVMCLLADDVGRGKPGLVRGGQRDSNFTRDSLGHFRLQHQDVAQIPIKSFVPRDVYRFTVDQLSRNPDAVCGSLDGAFYDGIHP
jgi:hypothetical protein